MVTDIATLVRVGERLQARLLGAPLGALGAPAARLLGLVAVAIAIRWPRGSPAR